MLRRAVAAAGGGAVLGAATALGWIDFGQCFDLLSGRAVNATTAFALIALLCWLAVAVVGALATAGLVARSGLGVRRRRSVIVLLAGALLLGLGIAHHQAAYRVCCAGANTAQQAENLAP
jgi:hypothetical protein